MSFRFILELLTFITKAMVKPFSWGFPRSLRTESALPAAMWSMTLPSGIFLTSIVVWSSLGGLLPRGLRS